jgi:hypothetical protein
MGYSIWIDGARPPSKKFVLAAMKTDPHGVVWENDSLFGRFAGMSFKGDELPEGLDETFVGPDPRRSRRWYGQIKKTNGKVVIK